MEKELNCRELAAALFSALKEQPNLLSKAPLSPTMLLHEETAQDAVLDWAEGRSAGFDHLPGEGAALATALILDFLGKLTMEHPGLAQRTWRVPAALKGPEQAKHAIAQELRAMRPQPPRTH